jgi:hypothetical protein
VNDLRHQVIDSETGWVLSVEPNHATAQRVIDARTRTGAATHMRPVRQAHPSAWTDEQLDRLLTAVLTHNLDAELVALLEEGTA